MPSNQGGDDFVFIVGENGNKLSVLTGPADQAVFAVSITGTNLPVSPGNTLNVDYNVENTGGVQDTQDIRLDIDGSREDRDSGVTLAAGNSTTGTLSYDTASDDDRLRVIVWSDDTQDSLDVSLNANYTVTIDSTNSPIDEGEDLDVTATIENTGSETGSQDVTLEADNTVRDTYDSLTLDASESKQITLTWATSDGDDGVYTADVSSQDDNDTTTVEVRDTAAAESLSFAGWDSNAYVEEVVSGDSVTTLSPGNKRIDAADMEGDYVIVGDRQPAITVFDYTTGSTVYTHSQGGDLSASDIDAHGDYYIHTDADSSYNAKLRKFSDGSTVHTVNPENDSPATAVGVGDTHFSVGISNDGAYVYQISDGSLEFSKLGGTGALSAAVNPDYALFGTGNNEAILYNLSDASTEYTFTDPTNDVIGAALNSGYAFISDTDGNVYLYDLSDGSLSWSDSVGGEDAALTTDRALTCSDLGEAFLFRVSDGKLLRTMTDASDELKGVGFES